MTLTPGLDLEKLCLEHISYIVRSRNPIFGVRIHLGVPEVAYCFRVTVALISALSSRKIVAGAYPILFEEGITINSSM